MIRRLLPAALLAFSTFFAAAQTSLPPGQATPFKDTASLKPPPGSKVAIIEFEDLECPFCARVFPAVHSAASQYGIPVEEYDFQIPSHFWSHRAAIFAHYLKARVSPDTAEDYRRAVFSQQARIETSEDLEAFNKTFMQQQGKPMPSVVDPTGQYDREVNASTDKAREIGVLHTPTILVVTRDRWIEVADPSQLDAAIQQAKKEAGKAVSPAAHAPSTHR